ncbi:hypothetical protein V6N13_093218 [Hibiscus sabdariffa]
MNKVADSLAQRGRELGAGSSAFYLPPEGTIALVIQEQGASGAVPGMHARGAPVISGAANPFLWGLWRAIGKTLQHSPLLLSHPISRRIDIIRISG